MAEQPPDLVFVYWALRGQPNLVRLALEYMRIPYTEVLFTSPKAWFENGINTYGDLPCLIDGDFKIHNTICILNYICKKYNHSSLMGRTIEHQAMVESHLYHMDHQNKKVIGMCGNVSLSPDKMLAMKELFWKTSTFPLYRSIENSPYFDGWFVGYITMADFEMFESAHYLRIMFPKYWQ